MLAQAKRSRKRSRSRPSKVSVSSRDIKSNVSVSWNCGKVSVSVSSQTEEQMSRSRTLRSRLHPWIMASEQPEQFLVTPRFGYGIIKPNNRLVLLFTIAIRTAYIRLGIILT